MIFCTVITAVIFCGCSKTVLGLDGTTGVATQTQQPAELRTGYVKEDENLFFYCAKVNNTTSRIYFSSVFVNTSTEKIAAAIVPAEFINWDKYKLFSAEYKPIATFTAVIRNIDAGAEKKFNVSTDITVGNEDDRIDLLYNFYPPNDSRIKLGLFLYKIEYQYGEASPSIQENHNNCNFL